jgi:hypothetical protein
MLEWWKDLVRPIQITDSQFGQLRYVRDARFWEGRVHFTPTRNEIEVLIDGSPSGPTEPQRAFFDEIQHRYDSLLTQVQPVLEKEARRLEIDRRDFVLVGVSLPAASGETLKQHWELSYETTPSSWHFTVRMEAWSPAGVVADC